jgi:peptidoglycan/LPS O-acetylase OafA/YrhL
LPLALAVTLGIAYGSWRLVERPALNLKKHSLYPHGAAPGAAQRSRMT